MRATLGIAVCGKTARAAVTEGCQRVTAGLYSLIFFLLGLFAIVVNGPSSQKALFTFMSCGAVSANTKLFCLPFVLAGLTFTAYMLILRGAPQVYAGAIGLAPYKGDSTKGNSAL